MKNKKQIKSFLKNKPSEIQGEITPEKILRQCILMSNNNILAFFSYSPHIQVFNVYVTEDRCGVSPFYNGNHYVGKDFGKSLAEIYQDLIAIETGEWNEH